MAAKTPTWLEIGTCKDEPSHYNLRSADDYVSGFCSDVDFVFEIPPE